MATKKTELSQKIYQIKVTLRYTRPPIWRRLLVPASLTLEQLHDVLQVAMGWDDSHLHEFHIGQKRFGKPDPNDRLMGLPAVGNERAARLFMVLGKVGAKAVYTYDFGDGWEHTIVAEKILPPEPGGSLSDLRGWQASRSARRLPGHSGLLQFSGSHP